MVIAVEGRAPTSVGLPLSGRELKIDGGWILGGVFFFFRQVPARLWPPDPDPDPNPGPRTIYLDSPDLDQHSIYERIPICKPS